jgi:hypothetical protein
MKHGEICKRIFFECGELAMLDKSTISRLSFIKYLYNFSVEQSYKGEPSCSISILMFHDAVELFNQLALEYRDIKIRKDKIAFLEYWDHMELSQKECMRRLNNARVAMKHHGNLPSKLMIESFRACATNFFEDNTQIIFKINFNELSLIDIIQHEETKKNLKKAEKLLYENNIKEALIKTAISFYKLINNYRIRKLNIGSMLRTPSTSRYGDGSVELQRVVPEIIKNVSKKIGSIEETLRYIILGIDYRKYVKFSSIAPGIYQTANEDYHVYWTNDDEDDVTEDDARFCINFVIETAIYLQNYNL